MGEIHDTTEAKLRWLEELSDQAAHAGSEKHVARQRERGKLLARERLEKLLDPGSFVELDRFVRHRETEFGMSEKRPWGDAVVTGYGTIFGRKVFVFSQDFTVFGGSLSEVFAEKVCKVMDLAVKYGCPVIGINDSGGARIQEGVVSLAGYAEIFWRNVQASGVVPQISLVMGPCAGGAVYSPAITDFVLMVEETTYMFITGPDVVKTVTGEDVELRGARRRRDACDEVRASRTSRHRTRRRARGRALPPLVPAAEQPRAAAVRASGRPGRPRGPALDAIVPDSPNKPYDMKRRHRGVVDDGDFLEVQPHARRTSSAASRGSAGTRSASSGTSRRARGRARHRRGPQGSALRPHCDAFNVPLVTFVDVPGFLPGTAQEWGGIIRHGAKLLYAYAEATVPKLTVITRKAYGGAYDVMALEHIRADFNVAWPTAEVAVMGPEGAVNIVFRSELAEAEDPDARRAEPIADYKERFANPYAAAERGYVDDVIAAAAYAAGAHLGARDRADEARAEPKRKHGNIPL